MIQAPYILSLWLGAYPAHATNFIILTLANTLLDTIINPMFTANLATGKIRIYHICNCVTATIFVPITYFSVKYTFIPEFAFIAIFIMNIVGIIVRLFILKAQIGVSIRYYIKCVVIRIIPIVIVPSLAMLLLHPYILNGLIGLIETIALSSFIVLFSIFSMGVTKAERTWIVGKSILQLQRIKSKIKI